MRFGKDCFRFIALLAISSFLCLPLHAAVFVVGPGHAYTKIQSAVDAASDGDTILVKPDYTGSGFTIDDKSLFVVADVPSGQYANVAEMVTIRNLQSHRKIVLSGLDIHSSVSEMEGLLLENNAGSIRIEACRFRGNDGYAFLDPWTGQWVFYFGSDAVRVASCSDVALRGCHLEGGDGFDGNIDFGGEEGREGMAILSSVVALYDCVLHGGRGGDSIISTWSAGNGGDGCHASGSSFLFAAGSGFHGGDGGNAKYYSAGTGGNGITLKTAANAALLDNIYQGGQGGWDLYGQAPSGKGISGNAHQISGTARKLAMPQTVREKEWMSLVFQGLPGDQAGLLISVLPDTQFISSLKGQLLLSMTIMPIYLYAGQLPGSGSLTWNLKIPELRPDIEAITIYFQSIFAEGPGNLTLGSQSTLVILDESY